MREWVYSGTPLDQPPLGPVKEGWPHLGEFVLKRMLWDFSKWPEYRGGHVSGVLIRGVPLYLKLMVRVAIKLNSVKNDLGKNRDTDKRKQRWISIRISKGYIENVQSKV